jgi:hypothetical protein
MIRLLLLFLILTGLAGAADPIRVALDREIFPDDFEPGWGWPQLIRLQSDPLRKDTILPEDIGPLPRYGTFSLGILPEVPLLLSHAMETSEEPAKLYLDLNDDGDFLDDGPPWLGERNLAYGRLTIYFPGIEIAVPQDAGRQRFVAPPLPRHPLPRGRDMAWVKPLVYYEGAFRFTTPPDQLMPQMASFYSRCWMRGLVQAGQSLYALYLIDHDYDGCYTREDRWTLVRLKDERDPGLPDEKTPFFSASKTALLAEGTAWRLRAIETDGGMVILSRTLSQVRTDPNYELRLPVPPQWPKAEKPIPWMTDFLQATARAREEMKPVLVLLTSPDCLHSRAYLTQTFEDGNVADLVSAMIPLHLETTRTETLDQIEASGFPYVLVLDSNLIPLMRIPGYRTVPDLVQDLETAILRHSRKHAEPR